jgi:hypothetical protein
VFGKDWSQITTESRKGNVELNLDVKPAVFVWQFRELLFFIKIWPSQEEELTLQINNAVFLLL